MIDIKTCQKAIKLLEQWSRLMGDKKLPPSRLQELQELTTSGEITSYDLPGNLKREFPKDFEGMTLNEIKKTAKELKK